MREIKFRGKEINNGEWVYGDLILGDCLPKRAWISSIYDRERLRSIDSGTKKATFRAYEVDSETIGQYTGLKDKNGKEIYEGDIIEIYQYIYETFSEGSLEGNDFYAWQEPVDSLGVQGVVIFKKGKFAVDEWILNWFAEDETEVIGDIYENPELLGVD